MGFIDIFRKEEVIERYNGDCAIIKLSNSAKEEGINDSWNLVIVRYRNGYPGNPDEPIDFTSEELKSLQEIEEIPVMFENLNNEFEFEQETNFGELVTRK